MDIWIDTKEKEREREKSQHLKNRVNNIIHTYNTLIIKINRVEPKNEWRRYIYIYINQTL